MSSQKQEKRLKKALKMASEPITLRCNKVDAYIQGRTSQLICPFCGTKQGRIAYDFTTGRGEMSCTGRKEAEFKIGGFVE